MFVDPSGLAIGIDSFAELNKNKEKYNITDKDIENMKKDLTKDLNDLVMGEAEVYINDFGMIHMRNIKPGANSAGFRLLKELIDAPNELYTIAPIFNKKLADFYDYSYYAVSAYRSSEKTIYYNTNPEAAPFVIIGFPLISTHPRPDTQIIYEKEHARYISLGHELIHALRDKRDVFIDDRSIMVPYRGAVPIGREAYGIKEEFQTVGLVEWDGGNANRITENDLRRQHNLPLRRWYE